MGKHLLLAFCLFLPLLTPEFSIQGKDCGELRNGTGVFSGIQAYLERSYANFWQARKVAARGLVRREEPRILPGRSQQNRIWQWALKVDSQEDTHGCSQRGSCDLFSIRREPLL